MDKIKVVCPSCLSVNALPKKESYSKANCGKCKTSLLDSSPINLTQNNFDEYIVNSDLPVVVDFWASWCGPCKMMAPVVEEVAKDYPDVKVCKVNVDEEPELSNAFKIVSIPTIVVIKNGEIIDSVVGYRPKEDIEKIIKLVK